MARSRPHTGIAIVAISVALLAAACRAGGSGGQAIPTLAGTPIPTLSPVPLATPVCNPPAQLTVPSTFPADVPLPPDLVVWELSTTPYLHVLGRVAPPTTQNLTPAGAVLSAILTRLRENGWTYTFNRRIAGEDYTFTAADGRQGHLNVAFTACPDQAQVTFDLFWVTG